MKRLASIIKRYVYRRGNSLVRIFSIPHGLFNDNVNYRANNLLTEGSTTSEDSKRDERVGLMNDPDRPIVTRLSYEESPFRIITERIK